MVDDAKIVHVEEDGDESRSFRRAGTEDEVGVVPVYGSRWARSVM